MKNLNFNSSNCKLIIKNFSFLNSLGYSLVTNKGWCEHAAGTGLPTFCFDRDVSTQSKCEESCTKTRYCVGYSYRHSGNDHCYLFPSREACPVFNITHPQFTLTIEAHIAESGADLVEGIKHGYSCLRKASGKIFRANETLCRHKPFLFWQAVPINDLQDLIFKFQLIGLK